MKILLHICCSNCALYPIKILNAEGHDLTGFWFNPNIHPLDEYGSRLDSVKKLSAELRTIVDYIEEYTPGDYFSMFDRNDAQIPPYPVRCASCYMLRLEKTAMHARENGFDAFSTTLLISPYQDFEKISDTGKELEERYNVFFHLKDFRPYFRDAIALSEVLGLYRQKYCGCIYSKEERKIQKGSGIQGAKGSSK